MRTSLVGVAVLVAVQTLGCADSIEDNCKSLCDWSAECESDATDVSACTDQCVENMKKADDDCEDALDDFADCVDSHDCSDDGECGGEAAALLADCVEYF